MNNKEKHLEEEKEKEVVEELVEKPMGDDDIKKYLPNCKGTTYLCFD